MVSWKDVVPDHNIFMGKWFDMVKNHIVNKIPGHALSKHVSSSLFHLRFLYFTEELLHKCRSICQ